MLHPVDNNWMSTCCYCILLDHPIRILDLEVYINSRKSSLNYWAERNPFVECDFKFYLVNVFLYIVFIHCLYVIKKYIQYNITLNSYAQ